jgi:peptide deformylase
MPKVLKLVEFGNPLLRIRARKLRIAEIKTPEIQELIENMYFTLNQKTYGVGIAAPQLGQGLAISTLDTKPSPTRPDIKREQLTIINPEIIKTYGEKVAEWEGCMSGTKLYAQVPRYEKIRLKWLDAYGKHNEADFDGLMGHVIQHEVDHLNGILFVDKVEDSTTYMTLKEYGKMRAKAK